MFDTRFWCLMSETLIVRTFRTATSGVEVKYVSTVWASCQLVSFSSWIPELVGLLSANCEVENRADDAIFVLLFHICHLETDDFPDTKHLTAGWILLPWITLFPSFNSFNKVSGVCLFQGESCRQEQLLVSIPFCELKLIKCRCEKTLCVWF